MSLSNNNYQQGFMPINTNDNENIFQNINSNIEERRLEETSSRTFEEKRKITVIIRVVIVSIALIITFMNTLFNLLLAQGDINCIEDKAHLASTRINNYFANPDNLVFKNALIIISALLLDTFLLLKLLFFILNSKSWRFIISISVFYILRLISQLLYQSKKPFIYAWIYPGFPSIVVSYLTTYDFYFNSQVGLILLCSISFLRDNNSIALFIVGIFIVLFQSFMIVVLRGAYIIDIITSIVYAHFSYLVSFNLKEHFDYNKEIGFKILKDNNKQNTNDLTNTKKNYNKLSNSKDSILIEE